MKIAFLLDFHFGIKNDARHYLDYQEKFLKEIFFPELEKQGITHVIQFGDIFDRRKYTNHETLYRARTVLFDELLKKNITMDVIPGNHDVALKNSNKINTINLFLSEYKNINQIHDPSHITYDGVKFLFIPWINQENYNSTLEFVKNSDAEIVIGHFEFSGFAVGGGMIHEHGMDPKIFEKFEKVYSGHFHIKSAKDNVKYLGTPIETSWADCDDEKGMYVFDTSDKSLQFIKNPNRLHEKIFYDDTNPEFLLYLKTIDLSYFSVKNVKLFVQKKTNKDMFEKLIDNLYKIDMIEFQIIEDLSSFHELNVETSIDATTSTSKLIENYVDNVDTEMDKPRIKSMMNQLYLEALMGNKE
jgi:DNA repair exonuclease SbcCD nuclease subunit